MGMRASHKPEQNEPMQRVDPGKYHVNVISIVDDDSTNPDKPFTKLALQIRQGTNPDMINRVHYERIDWYNTNEFVQKRNQNQICQFAVCCGLTTWEDLQRRQSAGEEINFDWARASNAQIVVEIEHRANKDDKTKIYCNVKAGCIWSVDDPAVNDVPKDEAALQLAEAADAF